MKGASTHFGRQGTSGLCLEQIHVCLSIVPPFLEIGPAPRLVFVVHLCLDRLDRKFPQGSVSIPVDFFLRRLVDPILSLTSVEMEEVDHAESVPVLISIENETEFVEDEFRVELGDLRIRSLVDDEPTCSRNGL